MGATHVATSRTDIDSYGDVFQWGRGDDGHQDRGSGTTDVLSNSDTPGHNEFIKNSSDWRSPQNDALWQGVSGTNNPCPTGWRVPTEPEWEAERESWSPRDRVGAYDSPLKLPVAGFRRYSDGSPIDVGAAGYYWSSTIDGASVRYMKLHNTSRTRMNTNVRGYAFSVRCIRD